MSGNYTELPRVGYRVLRTVSTSDDTDLITASTYSSQTGDSVPSGAVKVPIRCVSIQIIFVGTDAENEIMNWKLYGFKPGELTGGVQSPTPAEYIANGTATLGQQAVSASSGPIYYADTIAISAEAGVYDVVTTTAGANSSGSVAKLICNHPGFQNFYCVMTKSTCASMGAYITWH